MRCGGRKRGVLATSGATVTPFSGGAASVANRRGPLRPAATQSRLVDHLPDAGRRLGKPQHLNVTPTHATQPLQDVRGKSFALAFCFNSNFYAKNSAFPGNNISISHLSKKIHKKNFLSENWEK